MDKSTLSQYGWAVVVIIIILLLMVGITPFGNFIATGVESAIDSLAGTTKSLFTSNGLTYTAPKKLTSRVVGDKMYADEFLVEYEDDKGVTVDITDDTISGLEFVKIGTTLASGTNYNEEYDDASRLTGTFTSDKYTVTVTDGNVVFKPLDGTLDDAVNVYYCNKCNGSYYYGVVSIAPATSVYYDNELFTYNDAGVDNYNWKDYTVNPSTIQSAIPNNETNDLSEAKNYSNGTAKWCIVDVTAENNKTLSSATFKVTGTSVDIYGAANCYGVMLTVTITPENGKGSTYFTCPYIGYSYGQLYVNSNGALTHESSGNTPMYYAPADETGMSGVITISNNKRASTTPTHYEGDTVILGESTDEATNPSAFAYGWVASSTNSPSNGLYQTPLMHQDFTALGGYGTYTITISPRYSTYFDCGKNGFNLFYLDGIRVYNQADSGDTGTNAYNVYATNDDANAKYIFIRDIGTIDKTIEIENNKTMLAVPSTGSKSFALNSESSVLPVKVKLGYKILKNPTNTTPDCNIVVTCGSKTTNITVNSLEEKYIPIDVEWELQEGEYVSKPITVTNNATDETYIGLTYAVISYSE